MQEGQLFFCFFFLYTPLNKFLSQIYVHNDFLMIWNILIIFCRGIDKDQKVFRVQSLLWLFLNYFPLMSF